MAATAGLPAGAKVLPFFVDANAAPNPGGLPVGGVTLVTLPNNHFQYALTWFGLALVLLTIAGTRLWERWRGSPRDGGSSTLAPRAAHFSATMASHRSDQIAGPDPRT